MENFTPGSGFVGGLLIGGAASLFVLLNGRVAGVSGILSGLIGSPKDDRAWRLAFVAGIVLGPLVFAALGGALPEVELQRRCRSFSSPASWWVSARSLEAVAPAVMAFAVSPAARPGRLPRRRCFLPWLRRPYS